MRNILFRTSLIVSLVLVVSVPTFAQMKIGDSPTSITTGAQLDIEKSGSRTVFMDTGKVGIGDVSPASLLTVGSGDLFQVDSTGNIVKINNVTTSFPSSQGSAGTILTNNGSGTLTWSAPAGISADSLNFTDLSDSLLLDASTDVFSSGTNVLSVTNSGTGLSLRVNDDGTLTDTTPFVVDASGNVGIGLTAPASKLDVAGSIRFSTAGSEKLIANNGGTSFLEYDSSGNVFLRAYDGGGTVRDIALQTGNPATTRLFVDEAGLVGIGDTTPASLLTVGSGDPFQVTSAGKTIINPALSQVADESALSITPVVSGYTGAYRVKYGIDVNMTGTTAYTGGIRGIRSQLTTSGTLNNDGISIEGIASASGEGMTGVKGIGTTGSFSRYGIWGDVSGTAPGGGYDFETNRLGAAGGYFTSTISSGSAAALVGKAAGATTDYGGMFYAVDAAGTTNTALYAKASGATNNYAGIFEAGNVGIGDTTPASMLTVGSGDLFQVNSSGSIAAVAGITMTSGVLSIPNGDLGGGSTLRFKNASNANDGAIYETNGNHLMIHAGAANSIVLRDSSSNYGAWFNFAGSGFTFNNIYDDAASRATLILNRSRSSTTAPAAGFGTYLDFNLEGYTNTSQVSTGKISSIWENTQTNDTTDRDAALTFSTTADNSSAEQMRISSAGKVGIGTTSPAGKVQVVTTSDTTPDTVTAWDARHLTVGATGSTGSGVGISYDQTNNRGYISALTPNTAWRDIIIGAGTANVGIGMTTAPAAKLDVNGTVRVGTFGTSSATTLCHTSNIIALCTSSARYKKNIQNLTESMDVVKKLRPVSFDWKSNGEASLGFIAEDVQKIDPRLTFNNDKGQVEGVHYQLITSYLTKAMQELSVTTDENTADIKTLQKENADMKAEISDLKTRLESLEKKLK